AIVPFCALEHDIGYYSAAEQDEEAGTDKFCDKWCHKLVISHSWLVVSCRWMRTHLHHYLNVFAVSTARCQFATAVAASYAVSGSNVLSICHWFWISSGCFHRPTANPAR